MFDQALPRLERERALSELARVRDQGGTVLLASHDEALLQSVADELWWVEGTELRERGDPAVVLAAYRTQVAAQLRSPADAVLMPYNAPWR